MSDYQLTDEDYKLTSITRPTMTSSLRHNADVSPPSSQQSHKISSEVRHDDVITDDDVTLPKELQSLSSSTRNTAKSGEYAYCNCCLIPQSWKGIESVHNFQCFSSRILGLLFNARYMFSKTKRNGL